jgi:hypothetical protein
MRIHHGDIEKMDKIENRKERTNQSEGRYKKGTATSLMTGSPG